MGLFYSRLVSYFYGPIDAKILMLGLDAAGKTTILYKLKIGMVVKTIPTIGVNVETVQYGNIRFTVFDVGGQLKLQVLWHHYYTNTNALIFVVDSSDRKRIDVAREELHRALAHEQLGYACVLVFANKQDLPDAMTIGEVQENMKLTSLCNFKWFVQGCCATTGEGLYEGMDWIAKQLNSRTK